LINASNLPQYRHPAAGGGEFPNIFSNLDYGTKFHEILVRTAFTARQSGHCHTDALLGVRYLGLFS
jgi:hypothetical protein